MQQIEIRASVADFAQKGVPQYIQLTAGGALSTSSMSAVPYGTMYMHAMAAPTAPKSLKKSPF
eukprot:6258859-Prymnesium_polylepis.1